MTLKKDFSQAFAELLIIPEGPEVNNGNTIWTNIVVVIKIDNLVVLKIVFHYLANEWLNDC